MFNCSGETKAQIFMHMQKESHHRLSFLLLIIFYYSLYTGAAALLEIGNRSFFIAVMLRCFFCHKREDRKQYYRGKANNRADDIIFIK